MSHRTGNFLAILANSVLGLVDVYNLLPEQIVAEDSVSKFQKGLQTHLIAVAKEGMPGWQNIYSPRLAVYAHPLRKSSRSANGHLDKTGIATNVNNAKTTCINGWLRFAQ